MSINRRRPWNLWFLGTDTFAVKTLQALHKAQTGLPDALVGNLEVICPPATRRIRRNKPQPVPTDAYALEHNIPTHYTPATGRSLKNWNLPTASTSMDLAVVVSFGYLLRKHHLEPLPFGGINVHPSLLPKFRGPAPIVHTLLSGSTETGVTIIDIDPRAFDVGAILTQEERTQGKLLPDTRYDDLSQELAIQGASACIKTLENLEEFRKQSVVQDESNVSFAPKVSKEVDGMINWGNGAQQIYWQWQALATVTGVFTTYRDSIVQVIELRSYPLADFNLKQAGDFVFSKREKAIIVSCGNNSYIAITALKSRGKIVSALDFSNGLGIKSNVIYSFK